MMPDIVGTWRVRIVSPDITTGPLLEMEIRRVPLGFQIDQPWTEDAKRLQVRWLEGRGRFEGSWEKDGDRHKITLQPLADGETLRVVVANRLNQSAKEASKDSGPEDKSIGNLSTQDWTRISKSLSTTFPEKRYGMPVTLTPSEPDTRLSRTDSREVRALPDTPAAKQLVEQLGAQESAAVAEAATIRQLQSNGQAEQNKQQIAKHQRKLKNLLSTAFDLKLQREELQVQELQSRFSRLERQIGQRKELREKIIDRRAGELIEGDALKWSPTTPATGRENVGGVAERSVTEPAPATDTDLPKTSDEHSSSSPPSYQEFAKKLGTLNSSVVEAEEDLKLAVEKVAAQIEPTEIVTKARRRVAEAIRNRKAIQDEYAAVLRDLELQIESARAEVDATKTVPTLFGTRVAGGGGFHLVRHVFCATPGVGYMPAHEN